MFALGNPGNATVLNLLNTIVEANGPVYNGPGASKPNVPFLLRTLEFHQLEAIEKAKKYAMEQSIRAVLLRQTQTQQSQQLNNIKKKQSVALLNRVYVGSIAYDVTEDSLRQIFSSFGAIKTVSMSWDPATQKHKGFAFLEFEYPEAAQLAIDQMNNASFGGRQLKVGRPSNLTNADSIIAELVTEYKLENRVYISGIHQDLTEDDISLVFEAFGKIVFCRLLVDENGLTPHRGFGYIEYQNAQSALDAVASMNQFNLGGQLLRVCKAISPPDGVSSSPATALPPAVAVAAASATAKVLSMETEQLPVNSDRSPLDKPFVLGLGHDASPAVHPIATSTHFPGISAKPSTHHKSGFDVPCVQASDDFTQRWSPIQSVYPTIPPGQETTGEINKRNHTSSVHLENPDTDETDSFHDWPVTSPVPGVLLLRNMVGHEDCDDELEGDVSSECSRYGTVDRVVIYQQQDSQTNSIIVKVFVLFTTMEAVHQAAQALNGRFFAGRQITAEPYDVHAFATNDLSH